MEKVDSLTLDSIHKLKVDELKEELKARKIEFGAKDKKADLLNKLRGHLEVSAETTVVGTSEVPIDAKGWSNIICLM